MITDGLIIREYNTVGEADRFVLALTRDLGLIHASARGARKVKSSNSSATCMFCHSRLTLIESKNKEKYIVTDARPLHTFFELHNDLSRLALAQYFCELAGALSPREEPAEEPLRLLLNGLHYLAEGKKDRRLVKAAVELRLLSGAGYAPDLSGCGEGSDYVLVLRDGVLRCAPPGPGSLPVSDEVLAAMRHIVHGPFEKVFAFTLPEEGAKQLAEVSEAFLLHQLGRGFGTLDFYKTVG